MFQLIILYLSSIHLSKASMAKIFDKMYVEAKPSGTNALSCENIHVEESARETCLCCAHVLDGFKKRRHI
jgi:hypothetical protein